MKAHQYFRRIQPFNAFITPIIFASVLALTLFPARVVEVFLRKNFGERYYNLEIPIILFIMMFWPVVYTLYHDVESYYNSFFGLFALIFLGVSIKRYREIEKTQQLFDDSKYSYYSGDMHPKWSWLEKKFPKLDVSSYKIERFLEGLVFILIGMVLMIFPFSFSVGFLLAFCGLAYLIQIHFRYLASRHMVLDRIDEKIINEQLYNAFVNDRPPEDTQGFRWSGSKPGDRALREEVYELMTADEEEDEWAARVT